MKKGTWHYLRFFDFQAWRQPVHWINEPKENTSRPVQCLIDDCPMCQARMERAMLVGLPVVDVQLGTIHTASWSETSGEVASAPKANTLPDLIRAVLLEGAPCIVRVTKGDSWDTYDFKILRIEDCDLRFSLGDAEIEAFQEARATGHVKPDLGKALTRSEILEKYPHVGRAAMLADHFKAPSNDRADQLRKLFEKKGESE